MKSQLRKLVEAIVDQEMATALPPSPVFAPQGPAKVVKGVGEYVIAREFAIKLTPELITAMHLKPHDVAEAEENNGILEGEWELSIDLDASYSPGRPGRLYGHPDTWYPADPDEFEIGNWEIDGIVLYGARTTLVFDTADTKQLKDIVGDLTEREIDAFREHHIENLPEPDYDEPDYYD